MHSSNIKQQIKMGKKQSLVVCLEQTGPVAVAEVCSIVTYWWAQWA